MFRHLLSVTFEHKRRINKNVTANENQKLTYLFDNLHVIFVFFITQGVTCELLNTYMNTNI